MEQQPRYPPEYSQMNTHMGQPTYGGGPQVVTQQPSKLIKLICCSSVGKSRKPFFYPATVIVQTARMGPHPSMMTCPSCRASIQTTVKHEPSTKTHLIAVLLCACGCWLGCCLIPYCVDSCQNANHSCPNCGTFLGSHD